MFCNHGHSSFARSAASHRGFTLIEVLVVLGILSLLLAILVPVASAVRTRSRTTVCLSNLRQWSSATLAFAAANDGCLPRRGQGVQPTGQINRPEDWFNALPPVLQMAGLSRLVAAGRPPHPGDGSIWMCPEMPEVAGAPYTFSYAMNMRLSTWNAPDPDRLTAVGDHSTMVLMADAPGSYCSTLPSSAAYSPVARHSDFVNIAFLDGHVASFKGTYVGCGSGDPQRPDVRWIVPNSPWAGPVN
jgi:prepilin-type N-terminal cleavage/methylation domain-containing protein/prepilin-type processing-associated H-X9-DG protein